MRAIKMVVYYEGATFEVEVTPTETRIYPECPIADISDFLKEEVKEGITARAEQIMQQEHKEGIKE